MRFVGVLPGAVAWRHLRHPNILPLLGVDLEQNRLSMISAWMDQGNINEYVKRQGGGNRLQLVSMSSSPTSAENVAADQCSWPMLQLV